MNKMTKRLTQAVKYIQSGHTEQARSLILREVKQNPANLTAWVWALEVAANDTERRTILKRILALDPNHQGALQYLARLDQGPTKPAPPPEDEAARSPAISKPVPTPRKRKPAWIKGLFELGFDWISSLPTGCGIFAIFLIILISIFVYFRLNTSFFGLAGTNFNELQISDSYQNISSGDIYWEVQYEGTGESIYTGIVRYIGPIRIKEFPILTQDILVTSGDFTDPNLVETNVVDHKFFWKSTNSDTPSGSIHLIHALPADQDVYQKLLEIQKWDQVTITGREIYSIKAYSKDGSFLGTWQDMGCNSLLVESVTLQEESEE